MLGMSYVDRVTNNQVVQIFSKDLEVTPEIKNRKLQFFGYVKRGSRYQPLQLTIEG